MNDTESAPAEGEFSPPAPAMTAAAAPARAASPAAAAAAGKPRPTRNPNRPRPVHPVLQKLFELHPKLFGARFKPLKIGVFGDLLARHPEAFKRDELKVALGLHARSTAYLECVAAGLQRHDLDGNAVEPVAPEHVHHAIMEVFRRRQTRTQEDLRPRVVARLVAAIEASALAPPEYAARMRTQDELSNSILDEAVSRLAERAAKREALLRAFQASGVSVEAFAEMYGMDVGEVKRTLG